jgi:putative transposase
VRNSAQSSPEEGRIPMRKSRFTEKQIAHALRQAETGTPVTAVCRAMGVSEQAFYRWKNQYGGLAVIADLSLDKLMLQDVLQKKL